MLQPINYILRNTGLKFQNFMQDSILEQAKAFE